MKKNVASQKIGVQMVSAADGSAFTGSVTVSVTGDAGTQATGSVGSGACTHEGNGYHTYAPAQAETNYDLIAFTFTGSGAVPATVQVYTLPTTGILAPATADRTLVVDSSGLADANMVKMGPSGSGTAQTARDIGAGVIVTTNNDKTGYSLTQTFPSNFAALGINASGHVSRVTLADTITTYTGNTVQTGDAYAALTSAVPDSVPADGTRPSIQQAAYMTIQYLIEKSISSTTVTVKKVDGSTTLYTCTLDSASAPTSSTRNG